MDPLSIAASIIAVLQATSSILSLCYDFRAVVRKVPSSLHHIIEKIRDLRNTLESLQRISDEVYYPAEIDLEIKGSFELLCETDKGPLATCLQELTALETKILPASCVGGPVSKRKALIQALGWRLKDREVKASLQKIERCKKTLSLAITADQSGMQASHASLEKLTSDLSPRQTDGRHEEILRWLSPLESWERHDEAVKTHQAGTSGWFVESPEFSEWHRANNHLLWLSGFPGAGKTILFANAVQHLLHNLEQVSDSAIMAYVYCDFRKPDSRDPENVIGCLLAQIYAKLGSCPEEVISACGSNTQGGQRKRPRLAFLRECILMLAAHHKIVLLIDALDENRGVVELAEFLLGLRDEAQQINILITSRNDLDIQEALQGVCRLRVEDRLVEMDKDIQTYVDHRLHSDKRLHWLSSDVQEYIKKSLTSKSAGMFRWVQCQLDSMALLRTVKAIKIALDQLPGGLNETYERILMKIPNSDTEIFQKVLTWLAFAMLPLTLVELHEAVAIEPGSDCLDEESRLSRPQDILSLGNSLIDVSKDGHVRLAHLSVRDYLLSEDIRKNDVLAKFALDKVEANKKLVISCLTYLSFKDLTTGPKKSFDTYIDRISRHPLLKYASTAWTYHVRASEPDSELNALILDFFSTSSRRKFMSWVQVLNADYHFKWDLYPRHATSLYYAASFGLDGTVTSLLAEGHDIDAPGSRFGGTALHAAVLRHHVPVMKILLDADANPNMADFNKVTPLHTAVTHGNMEVIKLLLEYDASKDAIDGMGETPYDWAAKAGQTEVLKVLQGNEVERNISVSSPSSPSVDSIVWRRTVPYFPDFYGRRSGLDSSIILKVEVGDRLVT